MYKIEELLVNHCPQGVIRKRLTDICVLRNGYTPSKDNEEYWQDGTIPWFRMEDIRSYGTVLQDSSQHITEKAVKGGGLFKANSLIFATSATIGVHALITVDFLSNQRFTCVTIKDEYADIILPKYLYYYGFIIDEWCKEHTHQGGFSSVDMDGFKKIEIPIPPLPVQQEIVRILDSFADLQQNLQQELEVRKKQLESRRNEIFCTTLDEMQSRESQGEFSIKRISELGTLTRGKRFVKADSVDEGAPCIHYGEIYTYYGLSATKAKSHITYEQSAKLRHATKNDVIIVGAGENNIDIGIGVAWFGDEDVTVHDACYTFHHSQNPMYISHYLRSTVYHQQIKRSVSEGKICSISAEGVGKALIPIPSLDKQSQIVDSLNACEELIHNISDEIAKRQMQYEYYREQILSF